MPKPPPLDHRSKKEMVFDWLRDAIQRGVYQPGASLVIDELSRDLGVSQIPIREAMQQLESEGFVEIKPFSGATVTEIQPSLILEIFALLESAEVISGRLACQLMTEPELAKMEGMLVDMDEAIDDPDRWSLENVRLHEFLCDCARTRLIKRVLSRTLDHWDWLRRFYLQDVSARRIAIAHTEHWELLAAFKQRDVGLAEAIIRRHNRSASNAYIDYMRSTGLMTSDSTAVWELTTPA